MKTRRSQENLIDDVNGVNQRALCWRWYGGASVSRCCCRTRAKTSSSGGRVDFCWLGETLGSTRYITRRVRLGEDSYKWPDWTVLGRTRKGIRADTSELSRRCRNYSSLFTSTSRGPRWIQFWSDGNIRRSSSPSDHGNGTEQIFYASDDVLFVSFHQHPWFPGTGDCLRSGTEAGLGYNYNIAMPTWSDNTSYKQGFSEIVIPLAEKFKPQIILVSMGYDAHWMDHSSVLGLSVHGYYDLTKSIKDLASRICSDRLVFVLEGGYNLVATQECLVATFNALVGKSKFIDTFGLCPNKPVATPDQTIVFLKGLMEFMHGAKEKSFYDMPVEVPYNTE